VEQCASCLITQRLFHAPLLWKRAAGDLFVEATDYSPYLPHKESSSFSLTYAMCFSHSRVDERRCGLGGETRTALEEKRCLKRRMEDFREAMRYVSSLHFQSDSPPRQTSHVCAISRSILQLINQPRSRFRRIFSAVSPGSEQRLLPALFCDRLPKMTGRSIPPVCAATCGISDCASRFWKKKVAVQPIIASRTCPLPHACTP
jgi:hypothetical protein